MKREQLKDYFEKYGLTADDVFKHQHYMIITRSGIEKIAGLESINVQYNMVKCEPEFCVVQAFAEKDGLELETFGSAKYSTGKKQDPISKRWVDSGNATTWYIAEMAEKRAFSRAVLKITGLYELGVFGEDESEDFKKK